MKTNSKSNKSIPEQKVQTVPIAVIGMASIFPKAHNLQEYWDNILNKVDAIIDVPASRWNSEDYLTFQSGKVPKDFVPAEEDLKIVL